MVLTVGSYVDWYEGEVWRSSGKVLAITEYSRSTSIKVRWTRGRDEGESLIHNAQFWIERKILRLAYNRADWK